MTDYKLCTTMRELRARYDLTQEDLAECVGASRETIARIETGRSNPSLLIAWLIAQELYTDVDDLFTFEEIESPPKTRRRPAKKSAAPKKPRK